MNSKHRNTALKAENKSISLMYTINALSHLSRDEFELLNQMRQNKDTKRSLKDADSEMQAKVQKIIGDFNVKSIQEVIDIVENFNLFELYHF